MKEHYLLRSCLVDSGSMLLLTVEQVFLLMGALWSMCNADAQGTVLGEGERPKGRAKFFFSACFNFFLFYHKQEIFHISEISEAEILGNLSKDKKFTKSWNLHSNPYYPATV